MDLITYAMAKKSSGGGGGGGASSLEELNDVSISSPTQGQSLTYDETEDKWINGGDIVIGDVSTPSGIQVSHKHTSVEDEKIVSMNKYTDTRGYNYFKSLEINPYDIVLDGDGEVANTWITNITSLRSAIEYAAAHGGEDIEIVTATPIQNDDDHVELSVTVSQIDTYLSDGKTVFIDYNSDGEGNRHRYSLIRYDGMSWGFIFLRNNWDLITDEPYLECGRILKGLNNDPYVADYGYVTYPLGGGSSYTEVTGTLTAGNTSITLSDASITTNSTIDVYTDTFGINPTNVAVATGSVTLTFIAQANNLGVKVRVS